MTELLARCEGLLLLFLVHNAATAKTAMAWSGGEKYTPNPYVQ